MNEGELGRGTRERRILWVTSLDRTERRAKKKSEKGRWSGKRRTAWPHSERETKERRSSKAKKTEREPQRTKKGLKKKSRGQRERRK